MSTDMTKGSLAKALVMFSLPLVLSGLMQQLYSWADAFIVGNVEGELPLAAIGATVNISAFAIMMITGFTLGVSILAAQLYGEGERAELKKVLSSFLLVLGAMFLAVSVAGMLLADEILRLLSTPDDIFFIARDYLRITLAGIPFLLVYNVYSAVLRGMGDSRTQFLAILISSLTNILLDILFVAVFRYGASGAAVATVISQALMAIFIVAYSVRKYEAMRFGPGQGLLDRRILSRGLGLSLPMAIQYSVHSAGNLVLQNFMNGFGTLTVAAITTAYRVDSVILLPITNLGAGIAIVVAQNVGAGNRQRAVKGLYVGAIIMAAVSIVLTAIIVPTGGAMVSMFGVSAEAARIGRNFFGIIALFYLPFGIATAIKGYLEGKGDVLFSGLVSLLALGLRIALSYGLVDHYGNDVIAYAEAFSWLALLLMCLIRFLCVRKR
ncbi:MATE family efflux transporter [Deltaproteobacteria bacterium Smac51]|nr:MATE family efflux transporter [Deltaproteobacteria bacterium Smac51]